VSDIQYNMTRKEYMGVLISKGFVFEKTQMGYPSRGEQDVFTHSNYKYKFYITRVYKEDESVYGFVTGKINGELLDGIYLHNAEDTFAEDKNYFVWVDKAFIELMKRLPSE